MKTEKIITEDIHDSDLWSSLAFSLKYDTFKKEHQNVDESNFKMSDLFYMEVIEKYFKYGDFATIELIVDEDFNIVGGKILKQLNK